MLLYMGSSSNSHSFEYEFLKIESCYFARSYQGHDNLGPNAIDSISNTPPISLVLGGKLMHPYYGHLQDRGWVKGEGLQLDSLKAVGENFAFILPYDTLSVNLRPGGFEEALVYYEFHFKNREGKLSSDTLQFNGPAQVDFIVCDLDEDGEDEFISLSYRYFMNTDHYELNIYHLKAIY